MSMNKVLVAAAATGVAIAAAIAGNKLRDPAHAAPRHAATVIDQRSREEQLYGEGVRTGVRAAEASRMSAAGVPLDVPEALTFHEKATAELQKAEAQKRHAEELAAEASAAVAAQRLLESKEAELRQRAEEERKMAQDLEQAAREKLEAAKRDENLAREQRKHKKEAESTAEKKLAEQEQAMKEAAELTDKARVDEEKAVTLQSEALRRKDAEAAVRMKAAEEAARKEKQRLAAEIEAAELARRAAAAEAATARQREAEEARYARAMKAAEEAALAAQQALEQAKADARDMQAKLGRLHSGDDARRLAALQSEIERHQRNAEEAQRSLAFAQAEQERALHDRQASDKQRSFLSSWFRSKPKDATTAAVADAVGTAESRGEGVIAEGKASVGLVEVPGGTVVNQGSVRTAYSPGPPSQAASEVRMAEGSSASTISADKKDKGGFFRW